MKKKYGLCGAFDFNENSTGGQSVKTREFYFALCDVVGKEKISILESTDYKKHPISFFIKFIRMIRRCENTVIFPAQNGIKIFAPICAMFKGKNKIHYCVIGGWLPKLLENHPKLLKKLQSFNSILVETNVMKNDLNRLGLNNVYQLMNFKRVAAVSETKTCSNPIKLCYFSRVVKQKGIEDAVEVVKNINKDERKCIFDIYGPIVDGYDTEFEKLKSEFTAEICYKGRINPSDSIAILKNYDLQIFPTLFSTEGIPGSIVDSFFAGLPVVAARWNSFDDVVDDGITGMGFELGNKSNFYNVLKSLIDNPHKIDEMRINCLKETEKYLPKNVIAEFIKIAEEE